MTNAGESPAEVGAVQLASTIFKNFILRNQTETWLSIDAGLRQQAKTAFLTMLAYPNKTKVKSACVCIASVAAVELPNG